MYWIWVLNILVTFVYSAVNIILVVDCFIGRNWKLSSTAKESIARRTWRHRCPILRRRTMHYTSTSTPSTLTWLLRHSLPHICKRSWQEGELNHCGRCALGMDQNLTHCRKVSYIRKGLYVDILFIEWQLCRHLVLMLWSYLLLAWCLQPPPSNIHQCTLCCFVVASHHE